MKKIVVALCLLTSLVSFSQGGSEVSNQIRIRIESALAAGNPTFMCQVALPQFYLSRFYEPAWDRYLADELMAAIEDCENEALTPQDYHYQRLKRILSVDSLTDFEKAELDVVLTDSFILLASHLMSGKVNPQLIDSEWKAIRREGDPVAVLNKSIEERNIRKNLEDLKPNYKAYKRLKEKLLTYRKIEADGGWGRVAEGETLKPGMKSERVPDLRARLRATGDLSVVEFMDSLEYDQNLSEGVKRFQKRHGLTVDGNLGKETVAALNVPVSERIKIIELNMERSRWLPRDLGKKYIMVNLPAYELEVVKDGNVDMEMEVAVGKVYRQTPVFSSTLTYLVFNPYWTVPPTILTQDILPAQIKNQNYLDKLNIKVIARDGSIVPSSSVIWQEVNPKSFPYTLRQDPGPNNALGAVKFIFPNPYNIYMHDTNHRELFVKTDRALSSGCVRLSKPMDMAKNLLMVQNDWSEERIKSVVKSEANYPVVLKEPVQVHLQYWTAFVDENGILNFRKDIYSRDQRVLAKLNEPAPQS